jgi:hypothetical protein
MHLRDTIQTSALETTVLSIENTTIKVHLGDVISTRTTKIRRNSHTLVTTKRILASYEWNTRAENSTRRRLVPFQGILVDIEISSVLLSITVFDTKGLELYSVDDLGVRDLATSGRSISC